ncbi:hypothetical protein [Microbacterium sp. 2FI]|uniref:hypothetical protein n=1 Tax=Microbacterium sp. 2FI TaxID=2502193 RepID=UPI0010F4F8EA|nr:hypothetical protein [Microbacterium sp. 2FI]
MSLDTDHNETRWLSVTFLQGDEADQVLDMIDRDGPLAAIEHLRQRDFGDETTDAALVNGYVYEAVPIGANDRVIEDDGSGYSLTYSAPHGYVSLLRRYLTQPEVQLRAEHGDLAARGGDPVRGIDGRFWNESVPRTTRTHSRPLAR